MNEQPEQIRPLAPAHGSAAHPALARTWWLNLYPDGHCTGYVCQTRESALDHCTYTGDVPDAVQVEVRMVLVPPNVPDQRPGGKQPETL